MKLKMNIHDIDLIKYVFMTDKNHLGDLNFGHEYTYMGEYEELETWNNFIDLNKIL